MAELSKTQDEVPSYLSKDRPVTAEEFVALELNVKWILDGNEPYQNLRSFARNMQQWLKDYKTELNIKKDQNSNMTSILHKRKIEQSKFRK